MFEVLKEYKGKHGNCNVPLNWTENKQFGTWVSKQRQNYKKGKLTEDRIKRLENLGFVWDPYESQWEEMFEVLKEYKDKHGNCNVPRGWPKNKQLGNWVGVQRTGYKEATLSKERIRRLEDIGFEWDPYESQW